MSSRMTRCGLIAAVLLQVLAVSWANVTVAIRFISFRNPSGRDMSGNRCDFANACDHFFGICIDNFDGDQYNFNECQYGIQWTGEYKNQDTITFDHDLHGVKNPVLVHVPKTEEGVLLKVIVTDDDSWQVGQRHDPVSKMWHKYTKEDPTQELVEDNNAKAVVINGQQTTSLSVEFQTVCTENYYLIHDECPKYCKARNDETGHYVCSEEGDIVCREGWIEPEANCTTAEVSCLTKQCKNRGLCVGGRFEFKCNCTLGFTGDDCSEDVNECAQGNGALGICDEDNTERCENLYGSYTCHCKPGFFKDQCQFVQADIEPNAGAASQTGGNANNTGMIVGLVVGFFILILLIVLILALLLRERRKRKMKEQGTSASVDTGNMGQQTGPIMTNTGAGNTGIGMGVGTASNGQANQGTSTNLDNMRNQAASQTYGVQTSNGLNSSNGGPPGSIKVMEAGLLNPPPYRERVENGGVSSQFDNPAYGENGQASGTSPDNHVYDIPQSLKRKF